MSRNYKIVIAGGGTGGHIFPAIAIGRALQQLQEGTELLFVGALGKMEMEKIPQEGFRIVGLDIAGFNRSHLWKNWSLPFKLLKSALQAGKVLKDFQADAVVGVGGYASFPVLRAAQSRNIPTIIQEQNSHAGKSNVILAKKANAICVAYEEVKKIFPQEKVIVTGNPVRKNIAYAQISKETALEWFDLDPSRKTLLVVGGSLGAQSVNEALELHMPILLSYSINIIWQTGKAYYEKAQQWQSNHPGRIVVADFIAQMDYAYAAADVVVSRAGALAISELCIVGKPVIFVPFPFASEDHQTKNAMALVHRDAALLIANNEVKVKLPEALKSLLQDEALQLKLGQNISAFGIKNADERIAEIIINEVKKGEGHAA